MRGARRGTLFSRTIPHRVVVLARMDQYPVVTTSFLDGEVRSGSQNDPKYGHPPVNMLVGGAPLLRPVPPLLL